MVLEHNGGFEADFFNIFLQNLGFLGRIFLKINFFFLEIVLKILLIYLLICLLISLLNLLISLLNLLNSLLIFLYFYLLKWFIHIRVHIIQIIDLVKSVVKTGTLHIFWYKNTLFWLYYVRLCFFCGAWHSV
jgi:hypothetical protein